MKLQNFNSLYEKRLGFVNRAIERLYKELNDEDLKNLFLNNEKGNVNISVFGESQVGKTTMILKLIGIKEEEIKTVGKVLRGGRGVGSSSTLSPTIYSMSRDDYFYIDREKLQEDKVVRKIESYREKMQNINLEKALNIEIPKKYFNEEVKEANKLNIIDLPGARSHDEEEQGTVRRILEKYIPISNLILITERANQVNKLKEIKLPGIKDLRVIKEKIRYVLTFSISGESVRRIIKREEIDREKYLKIFTDAIKEGTREIEDKYIFPLEFGESYGRLDRDIKDKVEPILNELYIELFRQMEESKSEYNRIFAHARMYIYIEEIGKEKLIWLKEKKKKLDKKIVREESYANKEILGEIKEKIKECNKEFKEKENKIIGKRNEFKEKLLKKVNVDEMNFDEMRVEYLLKKIYAARSSFLELEEEMKKIIKKDIIEGLFDEVFYGNINKLNGYILDRYFIDDNYNLDVKEIKENIIRFKESYKEKVEGEFKEVLKEIEEKKEAHIDILKGKYYENEYIERFRENKLKGLKKEKESIDGEIKTVGDKLQRDKKTAKMFWTFVEEEYMEEKNNLIEKINKEDSEETLLNLVEYLYVISDECSKIKRGIKINEK